MNQLIVLDASIYQRVAMTLVHFLWEGAVLGLAALAVSAALRRSSARVRYGALLSVFFVMALCPAVTFFVLSPNTVEQSRIEETVPAISTESIPAPDVTTPSPVVNAVPGAAVPSNTAATLAPEPAHDTTQPFSIRWAQVAPYAVLAYAIGVGLMLVRLAFGLRGGKHLRRKSTPVDDSGILTTLAKGASEFGMRAAPAIAYCARVTVPTVAGIVRPMILLPLAFAAGLTPEQVRYLLLHELAHIYRHDHIVNIVQRIVEAFLFFHPAAWYVSRQIRLERELCCDELVLRQGGEVRAYVESLITAAALASRTKANPVEAAVLTATGEPSQLRRRIQYLLGAREPQVRLIRGGWMVGTLVALLAVGAIAYANRPRPMLHQYGRIFKISELDATSKVAAKSQEKVAQEPDGIATVAPGDSKTEVESTPDVQEPKSTEGAADQAVALESAVKVADKPDNSKSQSEAEKPTKGVPEQVDQTEDSVAVAADKPENSDQQSEVKTVASDTVQTSVGNPQSVVAAEPSAQISDLQTAVQEGSDQSSSVATNASGQLQVAPAGVDPELVNQLHDADWWLRKLAVQQIGEAKNQKAFALVVECLSDKDRRVQVAAAQTLGQLGDPRGIKHLIAALKNREDVQAAVADALTKFPFDQVLPILKLAVHDSDSTVYRGSIVALARINAPECLDLLLELVPKVATSGRSVGEPVMEAFEGKDIDGVTKGLTTLAASKDLSSRLGLATLLCPSICADFPGPPRQPSQYRIGDAVLPKALVALWGRPEMLGILKLFSADPDRDVRARAVRAAGEWLDRVTSDATPLPEGLMPLVTGALRDSNAAICVLAANYLTIANWRPSSAEERAWLSTSLRQNSNAADNGPANYDALIHMAQTDVTPLKPIAGVEDPPQSQSGDELRASAIISLGKLGDARAVPVLLEQLKRSNAQTDGPIVDALGKLKSRDAVDALLGIAVNPPVGTADRGYNVSYAAITALGLIGDSKAVPVLIGLLGNSNHDLRLATATALGDLGDASAIQPLINLLTNEKSIAVDINAIKSLGKLHAKDAVAQIAGGFARSIDFFGDDKNRPGGGRLEEYYTESVKALGAIGGPDAVKALLSLVDGQLNGQKTIAAVNALGDLGDLSAIERIGITLIAESRTQQVDPSPYFEPCVRALVKLGGPKAVAALRDSILCAPNMNGERLKILADALGGMPDVEAANALADSISKFNPAQGSRIVVALALAHHHDQRARPYLEDLAKEPTYRLKAEEGLRELGANTAPAAPEAKDAGAGKV